MRTDVSEDQFRRIVAETGFTRSANVPLWQRERDETNRTRSSTIVAMGSALIAASASASVVQDILCRSGLTKTALSTRTGVSRSLLDGYLKGQRQPSLAQIERLADAAGLRLHMTLDAKPQPVSNEYVAVMELASQLAGTRTTLPPLNYPHELWTSQPRAVA